MRSSPVLVVLPLAVASTACHESSSSSPPTPPDVAFGTRTSNLGLTNEEVLGYGSLRLIDVSEARQGGDLNGDGDEFDRLAFVIDLERGTLVNTGLCPGFPHSAHSPLPVVSVDETLAFAVSEAESGGLDRNGDGDVGDRVLAVYDRESGATVNLGLAASAVVASESVVAFDVPEIDQEQDLDGNGVLAGTVPHIHDRRTGETWNTGLEGTKVLGVQGDFVSLSVDEGLVGDRNQDGDALDLVFEVYDVVARDVQHVGWAMTHLFAPMMLPFPHGGRWAVAISEEEQGGVDADGDGDALDTVTFLYDPRSRTTRNLGGRIVRPVPEIEPLVLVDWEPGTSFSAHELVLFDPDLDQFVDTGLRGSVQVLGDRLLVSVDEEFQGEDLDHDGAFRSTVPVLYDLASGRTENIGIDGEPRILGQDLVLLSHESAAARDWNGDGDQDDSVLFTWEQRTGELVNTRLAPAYATPLGQGLVLLMTDESSVAQDLNGDGDVSDRVVDTYDMRTHGVTNLGLATFFLYESASDKVLVSVFESEQGQDLNGDLDQGDQVLHLVEVEPVAPVPSGD